MATPKKLGSSGKGLPLLGVRLTAEQRAWIKQKAAQQQKTESDIVRSLIQDAMHRLPQPTRRRHTIVDTFAEIAASVPAEAWQALPSDLNEQLDHYVYGTPKR